MDQKQDIVEIFYNNPKDEFYLRQISRITDVPKTTVARILKSLLDKKIIIKKQSEPFDRYIGSGNDEYIFYKKIFMIEKIHKSGLIKYIVDKVQPDCIILFGSMAKGEYDKDSDIDIFVEANKQEINVSKFELNHKIQFHFYPKISNIPRDLRLNILNGHKFHGIIHGI